MITVKTDFVSFVDGLVAKYQTKYNYTTEIIPCFTARMRYIRTNKLKGFMNRIFEIWFPGTNADAKIQILPANEKYDQYIWTMRWTDNAASAYMATAFIVLFIKTYGIFETA